MAGDGTPRLIQVASVSQVAPTATPTVEVRDWDWNAQRPAERTQQRHGLRTELEAIVDTLREASRIGGLESAPRLLLDELAEVVELDRLLEDKQAAVSGALIGEQDLPDQQVQRAFALPVFEGPIAVVGSHPQWRTTTLRTAAVALCRSFAPDALHLHVIDGARGLQCLESLPHHGTRVQADDEAAVSSLLSELLQERESRQRQLASDGYGDIDEQWQRVDPGRRLPRIVVIIDNFDSLAATPGGLPPAFHDDLLRLLAAGTQVGISVLAAGGETLLRGMYLSRFVGRLYLKLNNENDALAAGLHRAREVPNLAAGRAIWDRDESLVQVAIVGSSPDASNQVAVIADLAQRLVAESAELPAARRATRRRALPTSIDLSTLQPSADGQLIVGVGGDDLFPVEVSREQLPLVVLSPSGGGRSTALAVVLEQLARTGVDIDVLSAPESPVSGITGTHVHHLVGDSAAAVDWAAAFADESRAILIDGLDEAHTPDVVVEALSARRPSALVLLSMRAPAIMPAAIDALVRAGTLLFLAPDSLPKAAAAGLQLKRSELTQIPGRGFLVRERRSIALQVPTLT
jgi:S-DNA-T family DNA segregation ATPase FtsK/SpoIIIE